MPPSCQIDHDGDQLVRFNRFLHVHMESGRQSLDTIFHSSVRSQRSGWDISSLFRAALAYFFDQFVPVLVRHSDVRNQCIRPRAFQNFERVGCRERCDYLGAAILENDCDHLECVRIIFDNQYAEATKVLVCVHVTRPRRLFQLSPRPLRRLQQDFRRSQRKSDLEGRALTFSRARC